MSESYFDKRSVQRERPRQERALCKEQAVQGQEPRALGLPLQTSVTMSVKWVHGSIRAQGWNRVPSRRRPLATGPRGRRQH